MSTATRTRPVLSSVPAAGAASGPASGTRPARALSTTPLPAPSDPAPGRAGQRPLRLTRRGRVAFVLGLVALLCAAFVFGRSASQAATGSPAATPALREMTVQPGDTLWRVAQRLSPQRDTREVVADLSRLNHLAGAQLQVGQQLLLPAVR